MKIFIALSCMILSSLSFSQSDLQIDQAFDVIEKIRYGNSDYSEKAEKILLKISSAKKEESNVFAESDLKKIDKEMRSFLIVTGFFLTGSAILMWKSGKISDIPSYMLFTTIVASLGAVAFAGFSGRHIDSPEDDFSEKNTTDSSYLKISLKNLADFPDQDLEELFKSTPTLIDYILYFENEIVPSYNF